MIAVTEHPTIYLKVKNVVNDLDRCAIRKRRLAVDHLIGNYPKGPPVTLDPIGGLRATVYDRQDLWGEKVLGSNRYCGSGYLKTLVKYLKWTNVGYQY